MNKKIITLLKKLDFLLLHKESSLIRKIAEEEEEESSEGPLGDFQERLLSVQSESELERLLRELNREDLIEIQKKMDGLNRNLVSPYESMRLLFHGSTRSVIEKIRQDGFKLTEGKRSGAFGSNYGVQNKAIFLSDDKDLANAFGRNRTERGESSEIIRIRADIQNILDLTKWDSSVPKEIREVGSELIRGESKKEIIRPKADDIFWLIDQELFINLVKSLGYDSIKFSESTSTKKTLGLRGSAGDTIAVFDPAKLYIEPVPRHGISGLFQMIQEVKSSNFNFL